MRRRGGVVAQGAELKAAAVEVLRYRGRVLVLRALSTPYGGTPGLRSAMPDGESASRAGSVCDARWIPPRTIPTTAKTATQVPILVQLERMFMVSYKYRWRRPRKFTKQLLVKLAPLRQRSVSGLG